MNPLLTTPPIPRTAQEKILIVEDDPSGREILTRLFDNESWKLLTASDGVEALEVARRELPDVILLDIVLPHLDGIQVCRQVRRDPVLSSIPIIMVTGYDVESLARRGFDAGAEEVIGKPFNMGELRLRVRTILQMRRFRMMAFARQQFEWVVEKSDAGYLMLDIDDKVIYTNPSARRLLSVGREAGTPEFFELIDQRFRMTPRSQWNRWPNFSGPCYLVRPQDERHRALWLLVETFDMADEPGFEAARLLRLSDVSSRIHVNQALWTYEHVLSHKLRTPMNSLMGSLELLISDHDRMDAKEMEGFLRGAFSSTLALQTGIEGALDHLHHMQNPTPSGERTPASRLLPLFKRLADRTGLPDPEVQLDPALEGSELCIGEERLTAIFIELFQNSGKFHPTQRPAIEIALERTGTRVMRINFRDNGQRIPEEMLDKLQLPFFQIDPDATGEIPGMGLGLSMVATIVIGHDGEFHVRNRPDRPTGIEVCTAFRLA